MPPMKKKPAPAKMKQGVGKKYMSAVAVQQKARAQAMKNMSPAKRKELDKLSKIGRDILLPANLAVLPIGRAGAAAKAGRAVAQSARGKAAASAAGRVARGAERAVKKEVKNMHRGLDGLRKHPSGNYVDKRTGAVYDSNLRIARPGTKANAAKYRAKKIANSRAVRDLPKVKKAIKRNAGPAAVIGGTYKVLDKLDKDQKRFQTNKKKGK